MCSAAARPLPFVESLLGATAIQNGLTVFTRNTRDFEDLGTEVINPWTVN
jgi:predicted nucleic acid-binding protein